MTCLRESLPCETATAWRRKAGFTEPVVCPSVPCHTAEQRGPSRRCQPSATRGSCLHRGRPQVCAGVGNRAEPPFDPALGEALPGRRPLEFRGRGELPGPGCAPASLRSEQLSAAGGPVLASTSSSLLSKDRRSRACAGVFAGAGAGARGMEGSTETARPRPLRTGTDCLLRGCASGRGLVPGSGGASRAWRSAGRFPRPRALPGTLGRPQATACPRRPAEALAPVAADVRPRSEAACARPAVPGKPPARE